MKPPEERSAPELAYRNPHDDRPASRQTEVLACAAVTAMIWVGAVAGLLFFAFTTDYRGATAQSGSAGISIAFAGWATLLATMVFLSLRWRRRPERRHRVLGIWIGFGIACLVEGICFVGLN